MKEERLRILNMLAEGKISSAEADALLNALVAKGESGVASAPTPISNPKYLRVLVEGHEGEHGGKVNVRVPFDLIRAGVRLAALLPAVAHEPVNRALKQNGIDIDISKIKPENLDQIV